MSKQVLCFDVKNKIFLKKFQIKCFTFPTNIHPSIVCCINYYLRLVLKLYVSARRLSIFAWVELKVDQTFDKTILIFPIFFLVVVKVHNGVSRALYTVILIKLRVRCYTCTFFFFFFFTTNIVQLLQPSPWKTQ